MRIMETKMETTRVYKDSIGRLAEISSCPGAQECIFQNQEVF